MAKYRKRPVEIDAIIWDGTERSLAVVEEWAADTDRTISMSNRALFIDTLEGTMRGNVGDWIIRGVAGEIYPCKPDIFEATYELVEPD